MKWGDGLQVQPETLETQAEGIIAANSRLGAMRGSLEQLDVSGWQGGAADDEQRARARTTQQIHRQQLQLEPVASALHNAASAFSSIQAAQHRTLDKAHRWGFSISHSGGVRNEQGLNPDPRRVWIRGELSVSVTSLTFRLTSCDVVLAGRLLLVDFSGDARSFYDSGRYALDDGMRWVGDRIEDGLEWGKDSFVGIRDSAADFLDRRWEAGTTAWDRMMERITDPPDWLRDWTQDGIPPNISQVGGYAITMLGLGIGTLGNVLTGTDLHIFDDGRPYVGQVREAESKPYNGLNNVLETTMSVYERESERNHVNVTAVADGDGNVRYIASIPGTAEGTLGAAAWTGAPSGLDWAANFMHIGFGPTSATEAASQAIQDAINADIAYREANGLPVPAGKPELLLTGHSQGGIVAGQLITDNGFLEDLDVKGIVSAGSPQQTLSMDSSIPVYNFQTQYDLIPRADLEGARVDGSVTSPGNITNITLPHSGQGPMDYTPWYTHQQETYLQDIATLHGGDGSAENLAAMQHLHDDLGVFFTGETTAYTVEFGREVSP